MDQENAAGAHASVSSGLSVSPGFASTHALDEAVAAPVLLRAYGQQLRHAHRLYWLLWGGVLTTWLLASLALLGFAWQDYQQAQQLRISQAGTTLMHLYHRLRDQSDLAEALLHDLGGHLKALLKKSHFPLSESQQAEMTRLLNQIVARYPSIQTLQVYDPLPRQRYFNARDTSNELVQDILMQDLLQQAQPEMQILGLYGSKGRQLERAAFTRLLFSSDHHMQAAVVLTLHEVQLDALLADLGDIAPRLVLTHRPLPPWKEDLTPPKQYELQASEQRLLGKKLYTHLEKILRDHPTEQQVYTALDEEYLLARIDLASPAYTLWLLEDANNVDFRNQLLQRYLLLEGLLTFSTALLLVALFWGRRYTRWVTPLIRHTARLQQQLHEAPVALWTLSHYPLQIVHANVHGWRLLGRDPTEGPVPLASLILNPKDLHALTHYLEAGTSAKARDKNGALLEIQITTPQGPHWVSLQGILHPVPSLLNLESTGEAPPQKTRKPRPDDSSYWQFAVFDVHKRKQQEEALLADALTDPLTGLGNRRHFYKQATICCAQAIRYQSSLSVVMVDIDHFKRVNDTYGHDRGDHVLKHMVDVLCAKLRPSDQMMRLGGEELVILMPNTNIVQAELVSKRLCKILALSPALLNTGTSLNLTASFGVAYFREGETDLYPALARADEALYRAKHNGRNQVATLP